MLGYKEISCWYLSASAFRPHKGKGPSYLSQHSLPRLSYIWVSNNLPIHSNELFFIHSCYGSFSGELPEGKDHICSLTWISSQSSHSKLLSNVSERLIYLMNSITENLTGLNFENFWIWLTCLQLTFCLFFLFFQSKLPLNKAVSQRPRVYWH